MNSKKKRLLIIIVILIFISNIPPIKSIFRLAFDEYHYRYSNGNGSFTFVEFKAHDTAMLFRRLQAFQDSLPKESNKQIYRIFFQNPLCFWRWGEYFYDKRYKLPYKNWSEIKKIRGYDNLKYSNRWQDF